MKVNRLNTKLILAFIFGALFMVSCSDDDNEVVNTPESSEALTEDETIAIVESHDVSDELDNLIDDYLYEDGLSNKEGLSTKSDGNGNGTRRPDCAIKTIEIVGTTRTVAFDFGEGCEFPNGHMIAGKIIMTHQYDIDTMTIIVTQTFEDFTFNGVVVDGENTIVRTKENENGNPQSTKTMNITLTWEDGETASRVGTKTREWIAGYDTRTWGDNVYEITGNWATTFKGGTVCSSEITTALRREMACRFIVSGVIEITKDEATSTLDFGDGTCDNVAILTDAEGVETEIILRKRMKNKE